MERLNAYIGAAQGALQERPEVFKPVCVNLAIHVSNCVIYHLMVVFIFESPIAAMLIAIESTFSHNVLFDNWMQGFFSSVKNNRSSAFAGSSIFAVFAFAALQNTHYDCLMRLASLSFDFARSHVFVHIPRLAADESFISFHFARVSAKLHKRAVLHGKPDAMQHEPSRFLCNSDGAMNFPRTDTVLAVRYHPHGQHPLRERKARIFKDRSHFDGELLPALAALPALLRRQVPVFFLLTCGADRFAIRPAHRGHRIYTGLLIAEMQDCFLQCGER